MKTTSHLERLHKLTGLAVHQLAFEDHVRSYKEEISMTKTKNYSTLIRSQQNHPSTLFTTINSLLPPPLLRTMTTALNFWISSQLRWTPFISNFSYLAPSLNVSRSQGSALPEMHWLPNWPQKPNPLPFLWTPCKLIWLKPACPPSVPPSQI